MKMQKNGSVLYGQYNLPVQQPTDQNTLISVANHLILYFILWIFETFVRKTVLVSKKLQLVLLFQERLDVIVWLVMHIQGVNCRSGAYTN